LVNINLENSGRRDRVSRAMVAEVTGGGHARVYATGRGYRGENCVINEILTHRSGVTFSS